jgi:glutamine cyclotransferase
LYYIIKMHTSGGILCKLFGDINCHEKKLNNGLGSFRGNNILPVSTEIKYNQSYVTKMNNKYRKSNTISNEKMDISKKSDTNLASNNNRVYLQLIVDNKTAAWNLSKDARQFQMDYNHTIYRNKSMLDLYKDTQNILLLVQAEYKKAHSSLRSIAFSLKRDKVLELSSKKPGVIQSQNLYYAAKANVDAMNDLSNFVAGMAMFLYEKANVKKISHDTGCFTQGLYYDAEELMLYESCGSPNATAVVAAEAAAVATSVKAAAVAEGAALVAASVKTVAEAAAVFAAKAAAAEGAAAEGAAFDAETAANKAYHKTSATDLEGSTSAEAAAEAARKAARKAAAVAAAAVAAAVAAAFSEAAAMVAEKAAAAASAAAVKADEATAAAVKAAMVAEKAAAMVANEATVGVLRVRRALDNEVILEKKFPEFLEGITVVGDFIYMLTWKAGFMYVLDKRTLDVVSKCYYEGEGWGLTHDGDYFIMSNGSDKLTWFRIVGDGEKIEIKKELNIGVRNLNELEWVDGHIYANVWYKDEILKIRVDDSKVVDVMELDWLREFENSKSGALNGIAYDSVSKMFLVTGKNWEGMYWVNE